MPPPIRCEAGRASSPGAIISRYIGHGVGLPMAIAVSRRFLIDECLNEDFDAAPSPGGAGP